MAMMESNGAVQRRKAVIYARFSPRAQEERCESIETQFRLCADYCLKRGYDEVGRFSDEALSGDEVRRQGLWDALSALRRGYVLVAWREERLARGVFLVEWIRRELRKCRAEIEVVDGFRFGESPEGRYARQVYSASMELECWVTSARTSSAMLRHQADGRLMGSQPPYGKRISGRKGTRRRIVDDPAELAVVSRVLELRSSGLGIRPIVRLLNEEKVPARGREWYPGSVAGILRRYGGELATNGSGT